MHQVMYHFVDDNVVAATVRNNDYRDNDKLSLTMILFFFYTLFALFDPVGLCPFNIMIFILPISLCKPQTWTYSIKYFIL
ncbi:unnamed protein product [Caenorhabditis nigoni]